MPHFIFCTPRTLLVVVVSEAIGLVMILVFVLVLVLVLIVALAVLILCVVLGIVLGGILILVVVLVLVKVLVVHFFDPFGVPSSFDAVTLEISVKWRFIFSFDLII